MRFSRSTHLLFLFLETLTFIIRTGLSILVELINLVNSAIIFLSQMTILRWFTFLLRSQTHSPALLDLFISSDASICSTVQCCCLGFRWLSMKFTTGCPVSSHSLWLFSGWLGWSSWSFERCSLGDVFKVGASASTCEFCEWVQVGIDLHIPHRKYQLRPHSSPWFSAAYAAAIVHWNHFFSFVPKG